MQLAPQHEVIMSARVSDISDGSVYVTRRNPEVWERWEWEAHAGWGCGADVFCWVFEALAVRIPGGTDTASTSI
jgi:hypothetical protein